MRSRAGTGGLEHAAVGTGLPLVVVLHVRTEDGRGAKRLSISREGTDHCWQSEWPQVLAELLPEFVDPDRMVRERPRTAGSERLTIGAESESSVPASTPAKVMKLTEERVHAAEALLGKTVLDEICRAIDEGRQVRLALRIKASDPAWNLPWEYLQLNLQRSLVLTPGCGVARIVGASCGSGDTPALGGGTEDRATVKAVDLASDDDEAFSELRDWLKKREERNPDGDSVAVCVVVGHGQPPGDASAGAVAQQDPAALGRAILEACGGRWPSLVVLAACQSARTEGSTPSVAAELVEAGAPAVVGMAGNLETAGVAPTFLDGLCSALDEGTSLFTAVAAGRGEVVRSGGLWQYGMPVLTISSEKLLGEQDVVPDKVTRVLSEASKTLAFVKVENSTVAGSVTGADVHGDRGPVGAVVHIAASTICGSVTGVRSARR